MYRGKNQDYNITEERTSNILHMLPGMVGEVSPSVLKGSSLGILSNKKRGMAIFWGIKIYRRYYIGERMYRGKNK